MFGLRDAVVSFLDATQGDRLSRTQTFMAAEWQLSV
jgi:hypothetical protein